MIMITALRAVCFPLLLSTYALHAAADGFNDSIQATAKRGGSIVVNAGEIKTFLQQNFSSAKAGL